MTLNEPEVLAANRGIPGAIEATRRIIMQNLIREADFVERFYGSARTARRHRALGKGPAYIKIGRRIFYRESEIQDWLARNETHH